MLAGCLHAVVAGSSRCLHYYDFFLKLMKGVRLMQVCSVLEALDDCSSSYNKQH